MDMALRVPKFSLSQVAKIANVNPSTFRNWQNKGIAFIGLEEHNHDQLANKNGQSHKFSGATAIQLLLMVELSGSGISADRAARIAINFTHVEDVEISRSNITKSKKNHRKACEVYGNGFTTYLIANIKAQTGGEGFCYFGYRGSPTVTEAVNNLGAQILYGKPVLLLNMDDFLKKAKCDLGL